MNNEYSRFITHYNELYEAAERNAPDFGETLCSFIIEEFGLFAAVLFKIKEGGRISVLGKSASARKVYAPLTEHRCESCNLSKGQARPYELVEEKDCKLPLTDLVYYEGCIYIPLRSSSYLLRISSKTPFGPGDSATIQAASQFLSPILERWEGEAGQKSLLFSKLLTILAPELRAPANSIVGFASILNDGKLTPTQVENLNSLKEHSQKLLALLNEVIDVAKVDAGLVPVTPGKAVVKPLIEEVTGLISGRYASPGLHFDITVQGNVPAEVTLDAQKLKLILFNLFEYLLVHDHRVLLTVNARVFEGSLQIIVSSNDVNLPVRQISEFLNSFEGGDFNNGKGGAHPLMGLLLASKFAELMDGSLRFNSDVIKGTECTVAIKIDEQVMTPVSAIEAQISALPKPGEKNKVLVIESDFATSKLLSNYLFKWGYEPTIANSGVKAISLLENEQFMAIIMDIILPDVNGLELMKKIRENKATKNIPIIVCSVEAEQQKAFMLGAVEYFVKPISFKDLVEVLTSYKLKKNSKVLCVDDDVPTLNLIRDAIESVGLYPIAEAHSSRVMERIKGQDIDLAIVDLDMPELNGFELIKQIKSDPAFERLPIIIYTGKENFEEDLAKIDGLFTELLSKRSTKIEDLSGVIAKMMHRYEEATPVEEAKIETDAPKILLVEDYKHSQIIVTRLLKKNNFPLVVVVENGAEALDAAQKQQFDLILMDMQMPVMNGFEATERIRKLDIYTNTPIIALTAFAMKGDREKCLDAGATDYIPKPIDSVDFIEKVKKYTGKR